jgi:hypothetical protein
MSDRSKDAVTRRDFLRTGLAAGALIPLAGIALRAKPAFAEEEKLVTEIPAVAATVQALQYKTQSDKPDQNCKNCQFYTAGAGGKGKCQLFTQGLVAEAGWCMSWTKKVG